MKEDDENNKIIASVII